MSNKHTPTTVVEDRPFLKSALNETGTINYLAIGSNLLRSKLANRSTNNSGQIDIVSIRPGYADGYRLAFNLPSAPPLEPAMAGIEPSTGSTIHGALYEMTLEHYKKMWFSEGGFRNPPPYEEIIVDVRPYDSITGSTVKAVALRAHSSSRTARDFPPSKRYMNIIISGATEIGLFPEYIEQLKAVETARPSFIAKNLARWSLLFTIEMWMSKNKFVNISMRLFQKWLVFVYPPKNSNLLIQMTSDVVTWISLLPVAGLGFGLYGYKCLFSQPMHPLYTLWVKDV